MRRTLPNDPVCWIGEVPVYPGHPVTCALIILLAYPGPFLSSAFEVGREGVLRCESELDVPTAGGALTAGCALIRFVRDDTMTIDQAIAWGLRDYSAGGHADKIEPGVRQAERMVLRLREALAGMKRGGRT